MRRLLSFMLGGSCLFAQVTAVVLAATPAHAGPISIKVLGATYTTSLGAGAGYELGRTLTGPTPISDSLQPTPDIKATASADLFSVYADTWAFHNNDFDIVPHALASADTIVTFSPLTDATGTIVLDYLGGEFLVRR